MLTISAPLAVSTSPATLLAASRLPTLARTTASGGRPFASGSGQARERGGSRPAPAAPRSGPARAAPSASSSGAQRQAACRPAGALLGPARGDQRRAERAPAPGGGAPPGPPRRAGAADQGR